MVLNTIGPRIALRTSPLLRLPLEPCRQFSSTPSQSATLNQVRRGNRSDPRQIKRRSPALGVNPSLKGVCVKVSVVKPKKPNSAERKVSRVRLSTGKVINAYIPGEGHNVQQHSVVLVRGGRCQDVPGVKYHLVRGALDLGGVSNRIKGRSKYGTKKPQKPAWDRGGGSAE